VLPFCDDFDFCIDVDIEKWQQKNVYAYEIFIDSLKHTQKDFYSASSLKQQSADRHVALLGHIISIPGQPVLFFLLNAACLAEKQEIPMHPFL
jgi:hypothetical protein